MSSVTYNVALPFIRTDDDGELVAGEAQGPQTSSAPIGAARSMAATHPGAVAFSRTDDPSTDDFQDAVVFATSGERPSLDDLLGGE